jgi:hypothetical protein
MAIQFLSGLNVSGNIDLNSNQLKEVRIDNENGAPTGSLGRIYYDTGTSKLRLYNGAWVDVQTGSEGNTTYELFGVGSTNGSAGIQLDGSDGTLDNVLIVGAGTVGVTRSGNTLTVTGTDSAAGTVTSVSGGTGITISGSASVTPTVNIDKVGADNAILGLGAATPVGADTMWFSDATDTTLKKATIESFPGFGKDGTVTSVGSGAGLTGGAITASGTLAVDYAGTDNVVLAASDGTAITVVAGDRILVSDTTDNNAKFVNISQITAAIGGGTVTSVDGSGGSTGLTLTGGAITTSGTLTLGGTLAVASGGTNLTSYTTGDILYASSGTTLAKLAIGSAGQVLKVASGIPSWAADANAGGTVTSVGLTSQGDALQITGTPVTTSGNLGITFQGDTDDYINGEGDLILLSTLPQGTVTSVTAGTGMTQTGTSTVNPTLNVIGGDGLTAAANEMTVDSTVVRTAGAQSIAGVKTFSDQVVVPLTPTSDNNIASKAYVLSQIGGVGGFRGGYNASSNSPALSGGSNVAMALGDFFVVDVAGSTAGLGTLEPGDFVFADAAIPASSSPAASAYTVVIADQNIAGAGTTDGGTIKGVAGFQSATFAATSNGFITVKAGGITDAQLASTFNKIIGIDTDINTSGVDVVDQISLTDGVVQTLTTRTLPNATKTSVGVAETATQVEVDAGSAGDQLFVSPATLKAHIDADSYTATFPSTAVATTSIAAGTHGLGTGPLIVQCYVVADGRQVQLDVTVNPSTGAVTLATTSAQTANTLRVAMMKVR